MSAKPTQRTTGSEVEYRYDTPEGLTLVRTQGGFWTVWDKPYEAVVAEMSARVVERGGTPVEVIEVAIVDRSVITSTAQVQQTTWLEPEAPRA